MQTPTAPDGAPLCRGDTLRALLSHPPFAFYTGMRAAFAIGGSVQTTAMIWQVYEITGQPLQLAAVALTRFVPSFAMSFIGGAMADSRDRRVVLGLAQMAPVLTSLVLWAVTATGGNPLLFIYISSALLGVAGAFGEPARPSLLPQVIARSMFQRAVALSTTLQQLAGVVGPAAGGFLIASYGVAPSYLWHVVMMLMGVGCLACIRVPAGSSPRGTLSLAMMGEGLRYLSKQHAVLGCMLLDLFATIFAGATALLPIYASDILGVGAQGYGLLSSARAVGAFGTSFAMTFAPPVVNTGRLMILTVLVFGLGMTLFGLSTWFPLSLFLLAVTGASDQVSVVMRQSIIQLGTPDEFRGRVSSANQVFLAASNQLTAVESGLVATWTNAVFAVVSGGILCIISTLIIVRLIPELWRHRSEVEPATEPARVR